MAKGPVKQFEVMGNGDFPFDMLRYDACWPVDSQSAAELDYGDGLEDHRRIRRVKLYSINSSAPTIDRWKSFLWSVDRDSIKRMS